MSNHVTLESRNSRGSLRFEVLYSCIVGRYTNKFGLKAFIRTYLLARTLGFLGSLVLIKSYLTTMTSRLFENFTSMHSFYGECFSFNDKSIQSLYQCLYSMIHLFLNKHLIEKNVFFFVLSRAWDKEKILSPYEGSNLRPSDSALRCSTTRVLHTARIRNVDSVMFVDRNKRYGMY